ncbi:hypothetical protein QL285_045598 [Trifolium repens]|nr:hypothetical protein QL285_045598 [Trifolium repens]
MIPLDIRWTEHAKWIKKWMKVAPTSRHYMKRPFSAKRIRMIEYQKHVIREWLIGFHRIFEEDYTKDKEVEALIKKMEDYTNVGCSGEEVNAMIEELVGNQNEECMTLKEKKRKRLTEGGFQERIAKRSQLPPKKEDPGSVTIICQIGKA